ncbi:phage holin [Enterococcus dongliensis]|uniref:phage holin n=1 Tax=Enterococcus dongliensis TaxID=2559925 RepID=UPI002891C072|nr:phage holin [Enterococcus dongliensis]MDT2641226.1 phage holin [Enterococcus dongliensis]
MKNINFKIRFSWKENKVFIIRFVIAVFVPVLTYYGIKAEDLTTWQAIGDIVIKSISNPFVVGTMVVNALNVIPDPTTGGLSDSDRVLNRENMSVDVDDQENNIR